MQTLEKQKAAAIAVAAARDYEPTYQQDRPTTLTRYPHLEMTPAMSAARVLNTTIPIDFEHVRAEETLRQYMMSHLRAWSIATLHHRIHTQSDAIRFRHAYTGEYREVA
jgi:hypothetical protein